MKLISGTEISAQIYARLEHRIAQLTRKPEMHIIRANTDPASASFVKLKAQAGEKLGIKVHIHEIEHNTPIPNFRLTIERLVEADPWSGIMIQLPVYHEFHLNRNELLNLIPAHRDVDGLSALNQGKLLQGAIPNLMPTNNTILPATVRAIATCLDHELEVDERRLTGKNILIINHSSLIGRPLTNLLLQRNATVSICHEYTKDLAYFSRHADIVITAAGKIGLIDESMVKEGAIIIDVTSLKDSSGLILGDVKISPGLDNKIRARTPVPGGVGPVTVASLMQNLVDIYEHYERS